jgi:hypothetical protein
MLRRSAVTAALALIVAAPLACQQSVTLRINARQGQVTKYTVLVETFMQGGPMAMMGGGDSTQPFQRTTLFNTRTLTNIVGDTLVFTEVVDSARLETPAMPQAAAFMGGMAQQMRGMTTTTKMDRRARIFDTEVTGGPMAGMAGMGGQGRGPGAMGGPGGMGGRRGPGAGGQGNPSRTMVFVLPAGAVRVGESWSDSMVIEDQPGQPNSVFRSTFRLERMEGRVAVISINGSMDMPMEGAMATMATTGEFRLDLDDGRLGTMTMTMSGTAQTRMGEMPMRIQMSSQVM